MRTKEVNEKLIKAVTCYREKLDLKESNVYIHDNHKKQQDTTKCDTKFDKENNNLNPNKNNAKKKKLRHPYLIQTKTNEFQCSTCHEAYPQNTYLCEHLNSIHEIGIQIIQG